MQEVAALLLCKLGGKSGSEDEIKAVITAAGGVPNDDLIATLFADLEGKDVNELLGLGMAKLKDVPMGGGGGGGGGGGSGSGGAPEAAAAPKEEEVVEEEAPPAVDMFGSGGGGGGDY